MRIHHLNCGCMCPLGGAAFDGRSRGVTATLVCHCLAVETGRGLVLVDTGFGMGDVRHPERLSPVFRAMNNIRLERRYTALGAIEALGFSAADVTDVVVTHLDFDHAGGLSDFPAATVHVLAREKAGADAPAGVVDRRRYVGAQWADVARWKLYDAEGEGWMGFPAVRDLEGLPPEILMVPLPGHTMGHAGIAVRGPDGWLLHAGDAYFFHDEVHGAERRCPPGMRLYQDLMNQDRGLRLANQARLRDLIRTRGGEVTVFCSHDAGELDRLASGVRAPSAGAIPSQTGSNHRSAGPS